MPKPRYQSTRMENGITIVTESAPHARSISLGVLVDAGPRDENPDEHGIAHLCEHMLFQGTSGRDALAIARTMDGAGGYVGGFTTRDYTCFSASVLDEYSTYALDLFGDVFLYSTFAEETLDREKTAVICELESGLDNPTKKALHTLRTNAWGDHALGRPVAGDREAVRNLSREELIYFFHHHYSPNRLVIAAAGNVVHEDFAANVRDCFWRMLGQSEPTPSPSPCFRRGVSVVQGSVHQAYFAIALPAPEYASPNRYAFHAVTNILGGGISSRLFRRVREERGLAYNISAEYQAYRDGGMLVIEGSTSPENLLQVVELTLEVIGRWMLSEEPIDADELVRSVRQLRGQHLIASEDTHTLMSRLLTQHHYFGKSIPSDDVLAQIDRINDEELAVLAEELRVQSLSSAHVAVVTPDPNASVLRERLEAMTSHYLWSRSSRHAPRSTQGDKAWV